MLQGSLETRFFNKDYCDVLKTGVIEEGKKTAVQAGLRQLIDDTTTGVLILQYGNSVLCWLTGIPSSRQDYMKTQIRYAIALEDEDEPGKMAEWAGILCGLYSNQDQLKSLGTFLDRIISANKVEEAIKVEEANKAEKAIKVEEVFKAVNPDLTFDVIASFLKANSKSVQTDGIAVGCEFILASYLAEPNDTFKLTSSKGRGLLPSFLGNGMRLQTGVFWNGIGFSEVSHHLKKKGQVFHAKVSSTQTKQVPMVSNQAPNQASNQNSKQFSNQELTNQQLANKQLTKQASMQARERSPHRVSMGAVAMVVLILLVGIGVKLNSDRQTEVENLCLRVENLTGEIQSKDKEIEGLKKQIQSKDKEIEDLKKQIQPKDVKPRDDSGKQNSETPGKKTDNQSPKKKKPANR